MSPIPSFDCGEEKIIKDFAGECECQKTLIDVSSLAYFGNELIEYEALEKILRTRGIVPEYSDDTKLYDFKIKVYSGGRYEEIWGSYPSPENTTAKLDLIGELGLLGACIDIMRCPVSTLMMLSALYETNPTYFSAGM